MRDDFAKALNTLIQRLVVMEIKQVVVVRNDLKMSKGKIAAQVSHASVECMLRSHKDLVDEWRMQGMKKVVLKVENLDELRKINTEAEDAGLATSFITDAGHTEVKPGTITCLGIGPEDEKKIDKITGKLKML